MKSWLLALSLAVAGTSLSILPIEADAKRLGGGRPAGMQRQAPPPQQPAQTPPSTQSTAPAGTNAAAPATAGAAAAGGMAAAAKPRSSWMGPIAGIAAGLGIAALLSHLGLGEAFANLLTMLLLAVAAFFVIRFVMRRLFGKGMPATRGQRMATASAGASSASGALGGGAQRFDPAPTMQRRQSVDNNAATGAGTSAFSPASGGQGPAVAPDFDAEGFTRIAKMIFIRLQAANDAAAVDDLRRFTTPELFASLRLDLQERGDAPQRTDVVQLDAEVLETAEERGESVVSVRFHGLVRESEGGVAEPFDEVWHLVRPLDGSREWAIAGITPVGASA